MMDISLEESKKMDRHLAHLACHGPGMKLKMMSPKKSEPQGGDQGPSKAPRSTNDPPGFVSLFPTLFMVMN